MDYVTVIAIIIALFVGAAIGYLATTRYEPKMETVVRKASEYLVTYKDALVAQFGQDEYDKMTKLVGKAMDALADKKVTIPETLELISDAYPLALDAVTFIARKIAMKI